MTVYEQNLGNDGHPAARTSASGCVWRPEHTFVVAPSEPLADWEEEAMSDSDHGPNDTDRPRAASGG